MGIFKNKLITGLLAATAVAGLWYWWVSRPTTTPMVTTEETSPLSGDLLALVGSLNSITLDDSLFEDPIFQSLTDFGVTIPPQATGRRNPFAPI